MMQRGLARCWGGCRKELMVTVSLRLCVLLQDSAVNTTDSRLSHKHTCTRTLCPCTSPRRQQAQRDRRKFLIQKRKENTRASATFQAKWVSTHATTRAVRGIRETTARSPHAGGTATIARRGRAVCAVNIMRALRAKALRRLGGSADGDQNHEEATTSGTEASLLLGTGLRWTTQITQDISSRILGAYRGDSGDGDRRLKSGDGEEGKGGQAQLIADGDSVGRASTTSAGTSAKARREAARAVRRAAVAGKKRSKTAEK